MTIRGSLAAITLATIIAGSSASQAALRPVAAEDLFKIAFLSSEEISHDGSRVAYVVSRMDGPKNTYLTNIWIADVASGKVWQLTRGDSDGDPSWSPDGAWLAFDSGRGEKQQIFRISLSGGEAQRLTNFPNGASSPQWSHDGRHILFESTTIDKKSPARIDFKAAGFAPKDEQRDSDVRIITVQNYELNGRGYVYDKHVHLWVMNPDGSGAKALTSGSEWSETGETWSPDDKLIAFNSFHGADPFRLRQDIFLIPSTGGDAKAIPLPLVGNYGPVWGHNANGLYYFKGVTHDPAELPALAYTSLDGSAGRELIARNTVAFGDAILADMKDGGAGCGPLFEPHDRWYIVDISVPGGSALVKYDTQTGKAETIVGGDREISECSMNDDGSKIAYLASDATHPDELFMADSSGNQSRLIDDANKDYLASVALSVPEPFEVRDHAGFVVHAWIMHPPNAVSGRKYPTILDIHGGPETEFGNSFFHEFQYLAGLGYNVLYADPRGSVGFGYPFEAALSKHWGDAMFDDEMSVVDAAVQRPEVDASRLAVSGGSYGGYATLWIVGHTHRFKCAIAERAAANMTTQWLAGDANVAWDPKYSWGNPWDHYVENWQMSPVAYVGNMTTPLMLLHSDGDIRTPMGETLQVYSALKILGRTVEYVEFPRDNHDLSRTGEPIHRVERLHISAQWYAKYLK